FLSHANLLEWHRAAKARARHCHQAQRIFHRMRCLRLPKLCIRRFQRAKEFSLAFWERFRRITIQLAVPLFVNCARGCNNPARTKSEELLLLAHLQEIARRGNAPESVRSKELRPQRAFAAA